jgi:alkylated DNA nucleotide flippase Atl1
MAKLPTSKTVTPFQEQVYIHLLQIPAGQLMTYGSLARALNSSPRAVGGALRCNPYAPEVCPVSLSPDQQLPLRVVDEEDDGC